MGNITTCYNVIDYDTEDEEMDKTRYNNKFKVKNKIVKNRTKQKLTFV